MPISWNEIKSRAVVFSNEWKGETNEDAEAKSFWDDFFLMMEIFHGHKPADTTPPVQQLEMF